jgi:hypothetical protein
MLLKNGRTFPRDYLLRDIPRTAADEKARVTRYAVPGTDIIGRYTIPAGGSVPRSESLAHDPAYRAITDAISEYDLKVATDRIEFIALVTLALAIDPWDYVSGIAMRMVDNLDKVNKMDELEEFNARLVACEKTAAALQAITDDPDMAVHDARDAGTRGWMEHVPAPGAPKVT